MGKYFAYLTCHEPPGGSEGVEPAERGPKTEQGDVIKGAFLDQAVL